jgi:MFS family permease
MNPILIFIAVPIITAITMKRNVYSMMIIGTFVMAVPAFLLAIDTSIYTLLGYLLIMTIGEAMWQPRFLQYAAEIAPEGRTGAYMGVAQFPWFLTKMVVPLYSGYMLQRFLPAKTEDVTDVVREPETMWLYFSLIAISSTIMLVLAKGWVGKDFKTKS